MARDPGPPDQSGIMVYPRMPVPKRESESRLPSGPRGKINRKLVALVSGTLVGGGALGFAIRPALTKDSRVGTLETQLAEAGSAVSVQKTRADGLDKDLEKMLDGKRTAEKKLSEAEKAQSQLASKAADAEAKTKAAQAVQSKLQASVDKSIGLVSADGEEIHLKLVDKVMFKTLDDQLTDRGKQVLARVAVALKELPDKQIWVQGHTDDQPIVQPPVPKQPPPKKGQKPTPPPGPAIKFATNWELSAARALTVVHYLQDTAKLEPTRLAALAFGQYHPISRDRSANRRIEIVLYPKPIVKK
jgi:chemotaxis protein MotB